MFPSSPEGPLRQNPAAPRGVQYRCVAIVANWPFLPFVSSKQKRSLRGNWNQEDDNKLIRTNPSVLFTLLFRRNKTTGGNEHGRKVNLK